MKERNLERTIVMKRVLGIAALMALPTGAEAGQPISESLMQCSTLYQSFERQDPSGGNRMKREKMLRAAQASRGEAHVAAGQEGRQNIDAYLDAVESRKHAFWDSKGVMYLLSEEGRDWAMYCGKLGKHRGLKLG